MSSSHSTSRMDKARETLQNLQRAYAQIEAEEDWSERKIKAYLSSNPDYNENEKHAYPNQMTVRQAVSREDISAIKEDSEVLILSGLVDDLKRACSSLNADWALDGVCFGTVPGGGLDAHTIAVDDGAYAVVIPSGFFHLINLFSKIVILLQPLSKASDKLVYMPSASFEQFSLAAHPYIKFRVRDLVYAFFFDGDPAEAVSYSRAIPYQDRFEYLLNGTELFVLAHEVAHILLGHFNEMRSGSYSQECELEADRLALKIVTEHFRIATNYPGARASLCSFLFLSINKLWEETCRAALEDADGEVLATTHPTYEDRFESLVSALVEEERSEGTPEWYQFLHNGIRIAVDTMPQPFVEELLLHESGTRAFSARVMPRKFAHLGHFRESQGQRWLETVAELILSDNREERLIGLWLAWELRPYAGIGFYQSLMFEDARRRELFSNVLMSIEPIYESYLPTLMERFREEESEDQLLEYLFSISKHLYLVIANELGQRRNDDPMHHLFFTDNVIAKSPRKFTQILKLLYRLLVRSDRI